jgi:hypothetical protein
MKFKSISLYLLITSFLFACGTKSESTDALFNRTAESVVDPSGESVEIAPPAPPADPQSYDEQPQQQEDTPPGPKGGQPIPGKTPQPIQRQIIKSAHSRIQVKNLNESTKAVESLVLRNGGYVTNMEMSNNSYVTENVLTLRVPALRFDSLMGQVGEQAIFTQFKRITAEDVTEEYVDIETRLRTKREVRDRYVSILRNSAKTVKDVLAAEEQIRIIQEEIEVKEGRLRFLKDQVAMSTIRLELYQETAFREEPSAYRYTFIAKIGTALKNGWQLVQNFIILLVNLWPLVIVFGLIFWKRKWIRERFRRKA